MDFFWKTSGRRIKLPVIVRLYYCKDFNESDEAVDRGSFTLMVFAEVDTLATVAKVKAQKYNTFVQVENVSILRNKPELLLNLMRKASTAKMMKRG